MPSSIYLQRLIKQFQEPFNEPFESMYHPSRVLSSHSVACQCITHRLLVISQSATPLPQLLQIGHIVERKRKGERERNRHKQGWREGSIDRWAEAHRNIYVLMFMCSYLEIVAQETVLICVRVPRSRAYEQTQDK